MRVLNIGAFGTDVMQIQSLLTRLGYSPGPVDGVYGPRTRQAVREFQRDFGLAADGIVGVNTFRVLERFLSGYDYYTIRAGDTLYNIARMYGTNTDLIITANPNINANNLTPGQRIIVPYGINVVPEDMDYTYAVLERNIQSLQTLYPFIETGIAGQSVLGRNLYYLRLGTGANKVFFNGAHHALEWITSPLLMKFAEDLSHAYALSDSIAGYNPSEIFEQSSIYIMPMVNPDGVELVIEGLSQNNPYYNDLIAWNKGNADFSTVWQANNRGVDLNHNYNADWEISREAAASLGITGPGPTRYGGPYPESEPETKAVVNFTRENDFKLVLAYHSQGEVIFWSFNNLEPPISRRIGEALANASGYRLAEPEGIASYAGYKDWFIQYFRRPGYTVEVGRGVNPLPITQLPVIYGDNLPLLLLASVITARS
ncbi:MAG: M14 family metallopeptidase [Christensenellales bacterium]